MLNFRRALGRPAPQPPGLGCAADRSARFPGAGSALASSVVRPALFVRFLSTCSPHHPSSRGDWGMPKSSIKQKALDALLRRPAWFCCPIGTWTAPFTTAMPATPGVGPLRVSEPFVLAHRRFSGERTIEGGRRTCDFSAAVAMTEETNGGCCRTGRRSWRNDRKRRAPNAVVRHNDLWDVPYASQFRRPRYRQEECEVWIESYITAGCLACAWSSRSPGMAIPVGAPDVPPGLTSSTGASFCQPLSGSAMA